MNTTETLRFGSTNFRFSGEEVEVKIYPRGRDNVYALSITVKCCHLKWQVSSVAQIFNSSSQFSTLGLGRLLLEHEVRYDYLSSEEHDGVDPTQRRKCLRSSNNVKDLRVDVGLVKEFSRCLQPDDGGLQRGLLPELQELACSGSGDTGDVFTSFVEARRYAGRPAILTRR
jgi:hypothetical protein